jgi:16S rRNA (adenine1518-N6/adenine1519-N6)-dimethyltransferase
MKDLSDLNQLKQHLQKHGLFAQKSFGQNFLIDSAVLNRIVKAAALTPEDRVIEVGPGPGVLSQRIAPLVGKLVAVEIDEKMIAPWLDLMKSFQNVQILNQDVLHYLPEDTSYKLVANIPYYITSPILKHFLRQQQVRRPEVVVLMIQKEVAERICDEEKPTLLSWEIMVFGKPELVCGVKPESFYPSPKVDSAVLKIQVYDKPLIEHSDMDDFFRILSWSYKQPRKTLSNNLCSAGKWSKDEVKQNFENAKVDPGLRPHQLKLEDWKRMLGFFR